ncbi:MAG: helix-turn-helix domain-containing protein [Cyclonatronaceae bacterium]
MQIRPIHTNKDYQEALSRIEILLDSRPGSAEADELEILGLLVNEFERKHFPIDEPDPIEAIKFRMEQLGLTQNDLAKILGSRSRASEILSGKRSLSLTQIRLINKNLGIPLDVLIREPENQAG